MNTYEVYAVPVASCSKEWEYLADFPGKTEDEAIAAARKALDIPDSVILVACECVLIS